MNKSRNLKSILSKGFTLIELLIVIAVLGVLAAVVLVAIDPVQQLARGRDAGRKSTIGQLGRAMQAFYTTRAAYPTVAEWNGVPAGPANNALVTSGEIKSFPVNPTYTVTGLGIPCSPNNVNDYCYNTLGAEALIYARLESKSAITSCPPASPVPWFVFTSAAGRAGGVCGTTGALPVAPGFAGPFAF
jgi:general secretion pathway protein G